MTCYHLIHMINQKLAILPINQKKKNHKMYYIVMTLIKDLGYNDYPEWRKQKIFPQNFGDSYWRDQLTVLVFSLNNYWMDCHSI